ncbi:hypothetical protein VOLCADRAFT_102805 [Volvox carteri f. nagariensis]|uniref:NADH:ubiquinone oxidoreductase intermediate-associated protein 30 domain-containing protein n=1 Tax=Volvox carteri f. nagariensis TaxID=3068 RepID=D8TI91_VOLCA|nr:uncharacterized protein VOLCADRAFT_102805 [Volvox carteri f. nagariensis]EFJ53199.1 hypothetical protein VOLCADRAFT_102805 [Volvox carteri f. nagariensis]|eukprot:XP_002946204.1 hypothetical protein VOLCADRAFT_102805 [Volvox carteri f. nagariensis]
MIDPGTKHLSEEGAYVEMRYTGMRILRDRVACAASLALDQIPIEALAAGGVVLAGLVGTIAFQMQQQPGAAGDGVALSEAANAAEMAPPPPPPPPRENAVLVMGATGRLGRRVVAKLLAMGRTVVAGCRSLDKARDVLLGTGEGRMGLSAGFQEGGRPGILFLEQVDITNPESLRRSELWEGVQQVVLTVGTVFGPLPEGGFGVLDGMTSERVEAEGISSLVSVLREVLPKKATRSSQLVLPMRTAEELAVWNRLDDVIMGGSSDSGLQPAPEGAGVAGAVWRGNLVVEGGGFCGARSNKLGLDLAGYDGVHLRLLGDGQTFKLNIKTIDQEDVPESTYQATFDTVSGQWADVYIPWHNFVPVKRAQSDPEGAPLDPSRISKLGLVLSRFEYNKMPNPDYKPGPFELLIEGGIHAYNDVRPQLVMISSAGVERNAIIGDDEVKRAADIPIVQLNPNGTLNHKYTAEIAVRSSGYPYSVVRSTGMIDSFEGGPYLLQADQGDEIVGQISREEVAECLVMAVSMPEATGKTFELRRNEAAESKGKRPMGRQDYVRLFLKLALDKHRWRVGLQPMPKPVPPPSPVTEERRREIVAQVAVIRGQGPPPSSGSGQPQPQVQVQPGPGDGANGASVLVQPQATATAEVKAEKQRETVGVRA